GVIVWKFARNGPLERGVLAPEVPPSDAPPRATTATVQTPCARRRLRALDVMRTVLPFMSVSWISWRPGSAGGLDQSAAWISCGLDQLAKLAVAKTTPLDLVTRADVT